MRFREEIRRVEVFLLLQEENGPAQKPNSPKPSLRASKDKGGLFCFFLIRESKACIVMNKACIFFLELENEVICKDDRSRSN